MLRLGSEVMLHKLSQLNSCCNNYMWFLNLKIPEMIKSFSVSLTSTWRPINCIHEVKRKWKRLKGSFSSLTKSRNVFIVLQKGKWEKIEDDQTCTFWFSPISLRISELTTVLVIDLGEKRKTELWNCWLSKIYTNQASYCSYCSCVCVCVCFRFSSTWPWWENSDWGLS